MQKEVYDRYRIELEHEDNLINQRVSWFLVAQSLLFAALGISQGFEKRELAATVILVGFFSSFFILISVLAAIAAFLRWRSLLHGVKGECTSEDEYPQLIRPSITTIVFGFVAPIMLPVLFGAAWLFLAATTWGSRAPPAGPT